MNDQQILVLGAGVSGLTTAIRLQEAGRSVRIWAAAHPLLTTSSVAAAVWYPYRAYPEDRVLAWGQRSFEVFAELAADSATGVVMREGIELWREPVGDPWWSSAVPDLRRPSPADLPPGYRDGYVFTSPVIDMSIYLDYLLARFQANGGTLEHRAVESIDEATAASPLVIDCAGLGARDLLNDTEMLPIRGQVLRVTNPGLSRFWLDDEHPAGIAYIIPRINDCILGGTADENVWDTRPDAGIAEAIWERCVEIEPRLVQAQIIEHKVGLRPGRSTVRLERELHGDTAIVHNYGHGGAGVTLSWGCAEEAARLALG